MLGAIYIGLSGMDAYSKGLQTISNNVSNLNTLGYKTTSVSFSDVFNYGGGGGLTFSSGPATGFGDGVRVGESQINFKQGDLRQSDSDLDLAIQGTGFLVLLDNGKTYYARTGQFTVDAEGYISDQSSKFHLAVLNASNQAVPINIDAKRTSAPAATTKIVFADNLGASATDPFTLSNIVVYDSQGGKHVWSATFTPVSGSSGTWSVNVKNESGQAVGSTGTIKFIGGVIDPTASQLTFSTGSSSATDVSVLFDFSQGVTSYSAGASTLRTASVDGNAVGSLTSVTVDTDGQIKLTYSNTKTDLVGYVALADFRDPQQLERVGNGMFQLKGAGQSRLLRSAAEGVGKLVSKQVEASNVDLSQEFGDLILIQRGFQASSQVVSVSNDMIQELFGIRGRG